MSNKDASADVFANTEFEVVDDPGDVPEVVEEVQADPPPVVEEVAEPEAVSESSPEPGADQEPKADGVQKRINKLTADKYEQQRRADGLQAQLDAAQAEKPQAAPDMSEAPKPPEDMYDSEAVAAYHEQVIAHTAKVAQSTATQTYARVQQDAVEANRQSDMQQVVSTYANNAIRDGVDIDKLRAAEQAMVQAGINPELGNYIMKDANGGKIAEYLYDNPVLMHQIIDLDPVSAGIKIATEVKARALSTNPKVSNAPDPVPPISGGGGALDKDDFERDNPGTEFI